MQLSPSEQALIATITIGVGLTCALACWCRKRWRSKSTQGTDEMLLNHEYDETILQQTWRVAISSLELGTSITNGEFSPDVNEISDVSGNTPLIDAIKVPGNNADRLEVIKYLLINQADPNIQCKNKDPLKHLLESKHDAITIFGAASFLLKHGADPDAYDQRQDLINTAQRNKLGTEIVELFKQQRK